MSYAYNPAQRSVGNKNYMRYVGYTDSESPDVQKIFNDNVAYMIQAKCKELLRGVHPSGRDIVIQIDTIKDVIDALYSNYQPSVGDIYAGRLSIPSNSTSQDLVIDIIDRTIEIIITHVKNDIEMQVLNSKLTVWTTVLGDFNLEGLRSHDVIKVQEKRPTPMQFNMNY